MFQEVLPPLILLNHNKVLNLLKMLIKDFYKIEQSSSTETDLKASIVLNPDHEVYKGHFPTQAVVPGVIQLQITKELIENHLDKKLFMSNIAQVKYLVPIIPEEVPELAISINYKDIDERNIKTDISISFGDVVFTKAKINFSIK
jgi:3-hydroxyacyl-[acyl-carrier-protein] dehydratase